MFSMLILVLADNFLLVFAGWELVGLCSYLLIGFWYPRRSAAEAAKKAFLVNRIGDMGFALASWPSGRSSALSTCSRSSRHSKRSRTAGRWRSRC